MTTRIAINGFGRIGRNVLRALHESGRKDLEIVSINDLATPQNLAHLLKYDSVHGRFPGQIKATDTTLDIGNGPIDVTDIRNVSELNWADKDIDIVMECTGIFTSRDKASKHLDAGAKRVLISAPGKPADRTVVYGINHANLQKDDLIVSNGSCTTNALAPVAQTLHNIFGIRNGFMTTVHAYTGDQPTLDTVHKDYNRGRAAAMSMVPTSTGAAAAIGLVIPELSGKLDGKAIRVPTPNVSAVDLTVNLETPTTADAVNAAFVKAAGGPLKGVMQTLDEELVSIDLNHDPHSSSVALNQTVVVENTMIRVLAWYDNEWGFSCRMLDTAAHMASLL